MGGFFDTIREHWNFAAVFVAVVLVALLVNVVGRGRKQLRRTVILLLVAIAGEALRFAAIAAREPGWLGRFDFGVHVVEGFITVNLAAIVLFDIGLPAIKVELPDIVTDIAIGAGYLMAIGAVMSAHEVDAKSILGASAVVSAILALSLQSTLGNVIGGVALQLDGSFHEGDWLQLENGRQGLVKRIRWRHTVLETRDWGTLIVPNAMLLQGQILVLGKRSGQPRGKHRYWVYFNVDFRFAPTLVIDTVNEALQTAPIPNVAEDPKPHCICYDFASPGRDSFGYYAVRYWLTDLAADDPTNSVVRTRIYAALKRANIPLAMPVQTAFFAPGGDAEETAKLARHTQRRLDALRAVSLFQPLTDKELESLVPHLRYSPFTKGETATKQGNVAHWLYVLVSGKVEIRVHGEAEARDVACIEAPGFFGEMGLMTGEPRSADVVALTDIECYRLDKDAFHHVLQARPEVAAEFSHTLADRRVDLFTVRENLSADEKQRRKRSEQERILQRIKEFFALDDTPPSTQG